MGLPTFNSGDVLSNTKLNEIAQQSIIPCTSTSFPSSPNIGMYVYVQNYDCDAYWNGSAWVYKPKGLIARKSLVITGPGIVGSIVAVNNADLTWNPIPNESYKYTINMCVGGSVAGDLFGVQTTFDGGNIDVGRWHYIPYINNPIPLSYSVIVNVASNASHTVATNIVRSAGSGFATVYPNTDVFLEHIG